MACSGCGKSKPAKKMPAPVRKAYNPRPSPFGSPKVKMSFSRGR